MLAWSVLAALLIVASTLAFKQWDWPAWAALVLALSPVGAFIGMFASMVRASRRLDEMQRRIQLEALGATVVTASVVFVGAGQLQAFGLIPGASLTTGWAVIAVSYVVSFQVVARRYRG